MARFKVHLDHAAVSSMLRSQFAPAVNDLAESIARKVREDLSGRPQLDTADGSIADTVEVSPWTTDRARPTVRIAHPAGRNIEAREGVLTRAAADHGLEVKARRE